MPLLDRNVLSTCLKDRLYIAPILADMNVKRMANVSVWVSCSSLDGDMLLF
jgi:hypothetical protein